MKLDNIMFRGLESAQENTCFLLPPIFKILKNQTYRGREKRLRLGDNREMTLGGKRLSQKEVIIFSFLFLP